MNGGIGFSIPNTGSENFELESDGVVLGANVGYAIGEGTVRLEGGYQLVPVKIKDTVNDYNYGGFQLKFLFGF